MRTHRVGEGQTNGYPADVRMLRFSSGLMAGSALLLTTVASAQVPPAPPAEPPAEAPADPPPEAGPETPASPPGEAPPVQPGAAPPPEEDPPPPPPVPEPAPPPIMPAPQPPAPSNGQPGYGQPAYGQPGYGQPTREYGPPPPPAGYGYGPPGYAPNPGGYAPPPQRPPEPPPADTLFWSLRYDPFDLLFRRVTIEGEVALGDLPLSVEFAPSWIFDSPSDGIDEKGFDLAARFAWYIQGRPLEGFWLKANAEYERFQATLYRGDLDNEVYFGRPNPEFCDADSEKGTCRRTLQNFIVGAMIGNSTVFGSDGGFAISGGIGIGVAVTGTERLEVLPCDDTSRLSGDPNCPINEDDPGEGVFTTYNDKAGRIRLLGSLSLGVTF